VVPPTQLPPGKLLAGRFRVVRFIAKGGMGEVYEAEDLELGERVALKTLRSDIATDERSLLRFKREIQLARKVTHPNVCRIYDLFRHQGEGPGEPGVLFLSMELLGGETLAERLTRGGPMAPDEALPLVRPMASGLEAAHRAGVVHRDFNSKNVMLVPEGDGTRVVITDFGLAHARRGAAGADFTVTSPGMMVGTPAYMAPEQVEGGEVGAAADVYAFGTVLYEMVTGTWPFVGSTPLSTAAMRLQKAPPSPRLHTPLLDERWEAAILKCLERQPGDRFASPAAVAAVLEGEEPLPRTTPWRRHRWTAAALVVVLVGLLGAWMAGRSGSGGTAAPSVAVLGFKNLAGDSRSAWLSAAFSEMLATELAAGRGLKVLPGENVARAKLELGLPEVESLGAQTLAALRANLGAHYVVLGAYSALGQQAGGPLRLDLRLQETAGGDTVVALAEDGTVDELFDLVSRAGERLRSQLGVAALSAVERQAVAASLPRRPAAARAYAEGLDRLRRFDALGAREHLERAVEVEPGFPLAHAALSAAWSALGYEEAAAEEATLAYERSEELPQAERLLVEARYHAAGGRPQEAVEIYRSLWRFYPDDLEHGLRLAEAEIAAGQAGRAVEMVAALRPLAGGDPRVDLMEAEAAKAVSDYEAQRRAAAAAASAAAAGGARLLLARARLVEGIALRQLGEIDAAATAYSEARGIYSELGDRGGEATVLNSLAILEKNNRGDPATARQLYRRSLEISRQIGDAGGVARALNNLAILEARQGDLAAARSMYEEALNVFRDVGARDREAHTLSNLGNLLSRQGDLLAARRRFEEALTALRQVGDQGGVASTLLNLANLLLEGGGLAEAQARYREAVALSQSIGGKSELAYALAGQAEVVRYGGDLAAASEQLEEALRLSRELGDARLTAWVLTSLGEMRLLAGELAAARPLLEESLALRRQLDAVEVAESQLALASLALAEGDAASAAELAAAAGEAYAAAGRNDAAAIARARGAEAALLAADGATAWREVTAASAAVADSPRVWGRLEVAAAAGRIAAATGRSDGAVREQVGLALEEARELGIVSAELELRLVSALLDRVAGQADADQRLAQLARDAGDHGFTALAAEARSQLAQRPAA
jgi:tetratricopeptide (TPR) repeat protein